MKTSEAMRDWLSHYFDGSQNGERYQTNSVYTGGKGDGVRGIKTCRNHGLIRSYQDDRLQKGGYRHDLTAKGREVVDSMQVEHDATKATLEAEKEMWMGDMLRHGIFPENNSPWYGS